MSRAKEENLLENDPIVKKIIKIYENYGMDISNMSEEEFERLRSKYVGNKAQLNQDVKNSEKYRGKFTDDVL